MIVRRLLSGVLLAGLAATTLAAAPHPRVARAGGHDADPTLPVVGMRVFARADAGDEPASPAAAASTAPEPAAAAPVAAPPAASLPSPEVAARARAVLEANRSGKIDRSQYTSEMNRYITDPALALASEELRSLGEVKAFTQVRKITQGPLTVYVFRIEFAKPPLFEQAIGWNAAGKVDYLSFTPKI